MTKTKATTPDTMTVWNQVEQTDARHTTRFNAGSYKGTAICTMYNVQRATVLWGPMGSAWGASVEDVSFVTDDDPKAGKVTVCHVRIKLWFPDGDKAGHVTAFGGTKSAYTSKQGRRIVDEDAIKKSFTDALGKALSYLGFSADVYLGKHDDRAYVDSLQHGSNAADPPSAARPEPADLTPDQMRANCKPLLTAACGLATQPSEWAEADFVRIGELVQSLCDRAQIPAVDKLATIPDEHAEAFWLACKELGAEK